MEEDWVVVSDSGESDDEANDFLHSAIPVDRTMDRVISTLRTSSQISVDAVAFGIEKALRATDWAFRLINDVRMRESIKRQLRDAQRARNRIEHELLQRREQENAMVTELQLLREKLAVSESGASVDPAQPQNNSLRTIAGSRDGVTCGLCGGVLAFGWTLACGDTFCYSCARKALLSDPVTAHARHFDFKRFARHVHGDGDPARTPWRRVSTWRRFRGLLT
jgi:hypothetical protein